MCDVENAITMNQIAIFTDDPGWHGTRLKRAFAARGFDSCYVSLTACRSKKLVMPLSTVRSMAWASL